MKREILFRGRYAREKAWVYGSLIAGSGILDNDEHGGMLHPIDFNTVGQYTGLKDKNGKKIFDGDVLMFSIMGDDGYVVIVSMENSAWGFYPAFPELVHEDDQKWRSFWDPEYDEVWKRNYFTVIGNIYDNPELIGGGEC